MLLSNPRTELSATVLNFLESSFTALPFPNNFAVSSFLLSVFFFDFPGKFVFEVSVLTSDGGTPKLFAIGVMIFPRIGVSACPTGLIPLTTLEILARIPAPTPLNGAMKRSDSFCACLESPPPLNIPPKDERG